MERGKDKRKKGEKESDHQVKKRGREGEEVEAVGRGTAAEDEEDVEEFFAILRRMQVAVKYFERRSNGEGWRAAVASVVGDGGHEEEEEEGVMKNGAEQDRQAAAAAPAVEEERGVLDLNTVPPISGGS